MPKETLSTQDLVSDARQTRFLQELSDHLEDSGDGIGVGTADELAETFNGYARPKRNRRLLLLAGIAVITFAFSFVVTQDVFMENHFFHRLMNELPPQISVAIFLIGFFIQLPATLLIATIGFLIQQYVGAPSEWLLGLIPYISSVSWTIIASLLLFNPPRYEILQRNLKRRA